MLGTRAIVSRLSSQNGSQPSSSAAKSRTRPLTRRVGRSQVLKSQRQLQTSSLKEGKPIEADVSARPSYYREVSSIRKKFLSYFEENGHLIVPSSNIVPANDPSLLFTSAGMVQFKESFLGLRKPVAPAVTTVQKCVRAGGKHNDLDNVGFTARHHTFFEMLGNFSFGAYDKREAIRLAWTFLTKEIGLPRDRLSVTVLNGDTNTRQAWRDVAGLSDTLIRECGEEDNFWSMGDVGPCGPCSEIFWDQQTPVDGDQFLEIWNLVFMQNRVSKVTQQDGTITSEISTLPVPCIDTGMGLERLASVLQGKRENYQIDTLGALLIQTQHVIESKLGRLLPIGTPAVDAALRVIVDHIRSSSFLISEGLMPGNNGRAYVLRRIIRRATRYAHSLGINQPIMAEIFPVLAETMADAYPELLERRDHITNTLYHEELSFFGTLHKGMDEFAKLLEIRELQADRVVPGPEVFKLYETYGFPVDLTDLIAKEKGWTVDMKGFEEVIAEQRKKDRLTWRGSGDDAVPLAICQWTAVPKFTGYDHLIEPRAEVVEVVEQHTVSSSSSSSSSSAGKLAEAEEFWVSIDPCPFYAESGGQVGDRGIIVASDHTFHVLDALHPYPGGIALKIKHSHLEGETPLSADQVRSILAKGSTVRAVVDSTWRRNVRKNHTATHLLHSALREVLGSHVIQAGSRVSPETLRFDFAHYDPLTSEEVKSVEKWVNQAIQANVDMHTDLMTYDEAVAKKAMALFSEKYDKQTKLRVVNVPGLSVELCGGTHVSDTSEIGLFKIVNQTSVGTGVRRIEALTGSFALDWLSDRSSMVDRIAEILNARADVNGIPSKIERLLQIRKEANKEIDTLKEQLMAQSLASARSTSSSSSSSSSSGAQDGYRCLEGSHEGRAFAIHVYTGGVVPFDLKYLRSAGDKLRAEAPTKTHALLTPEWIVLCADNAPSKDYLRTVLTQVGVPGGGPPHMVSASLGKLGLDEALARLTSLAAAK